MGIMMISIPQFIQNAGRHIRLHFMEGNGWHGRDWKRIFYSGSIEWVVEQSQKGGRQSGLLKPTCKQIKLSFHHFAWKLKVALKFIQTPRPFSSHELGCCLMICCSKDAQIVINRDGSDGKIGCWVGRPSIHFQYCSVHEYFARFRLPPWGMKKLFLGLSCMAKLFDKIQETQVTRWVNFSLISVIHKCTNSPSFRDFLPRIRESKTWDVVLAGYAIQGI